MATPRGYTVRFESPTVERYCFIRLVSGLSAKSLEAATLGLRGTQFAVSIIYDDSQQVVGMGRLVGDGGCFFEVVDIAVIPEHQKKGLGKLIVRTISKHVHENLPKTAYVSLIADGKANKLYEKYGFSDVMPASRGMALEVGKSKMMF
jgi:ribosomal protein S18 acetylase RimI-like enzyme